MLTPNIQPMLPLLAVEDLDLIPLQKAGAKDKQGKYAGKRPLHNDWRNDKPLTESTLRKYVDQGHNIGARLGRSILVVDIDPKNFAVEGETTRDGQTLDPRPDVLLEDTFAFDRHSYPVVHTGSFFKDLSMTGQHIYMRIPGGWIDEDKKLRRGLVQFKGIDFKWFGGQVLVPGCFNDENKRAYEVNPSAADMADGIPDAPRELIEALLQPIQRRQSDHDGEVISEEQLAKVLAELDPGDFRNHDDWLKFMVSCIAATNGDGLHAFIEWSTSDPPYADAEGDIKYRWDTFEPNPGEGSEAITIGTFYKILEEHGCDYHPTDLAAYTETADEDKALVAGDKLGPLLPANMNMSGDKYTDTQTNALKFLAKISQKEGWLIRKNTFAQQIEITGENLPWDPAEYPFVNTELLETRLWLYINAYFPNYQFTKDISTTNISGALKVMAREAKYNPVTEYLNELKWDGEKRIDRWITDRLGGPDNALTRATSRLLFRALVARAYVPGAKYDALIILEGMQGTQKSTALKELCPNETWFTDHAFEFGNRGNPADAIMPFLGKWIHEFAEISTLTPATMNKAKAMLSTSVDQFRRPYGKGFEDAPRGFVTVGTTNDSVYLADMTGNRRYIPIRLNDQMIDTAAIPGERDQLFAEAVEVYKKAPNAPLHLPPELWAAAAEAVDQRQADHPWKVILEDFLENRTRVASKELLNKLHIKGARGSQETKTLAAVMASLGWSHKQIRIPTEEWSEDWHGGALDMKPGGTFRGYFLDLAT